MEISKKLKDFLFQDSVEELINENDFEGLYKKVRGTCPVGELTPVLYAAGIDPLRYLVYIPDGFLEYSDIEHFTIPNHIKSIGSRAFSGCNELTSIALGNGIESIGGYAFHGCEELMNVTIGSGVTEIEFGAFAGCTKLREINYSGTMDQWKKIAVSNNNNKRLQGCKIICSDGNLKWDRTSSEWMEI